MSEIEIDVDVRHADNPENVEPGYESLMTIAATDNLGTQHLKLPEEDAVRLAEEITAAVEQQDKN